MGLLDFLHGGRPRKSEAEIYMEQRNKEYARKAAAYRRKEAMSGMIERMSSTINVQCTPNHNNVTVTRTVKTLPVEKSMAAIDKIAKELGIPTQQLKDDLARDGKKTVTIKRTINKTTIGNDIHKSLFQNTCDDCNNSESIYDSQETDLFIVEIASVKAALRAVNASGNILRGSFKVGDKVQIVSSLETRDSVITGIIRQGESVEYANTSSGPVGLVLANVADMMIRKGDKIVKGRISYFK